MDRNSQWKENRNNQWKEGDNRKSVIDHKYTKKNKKKDDLLKGRSFERGFFLSFLEAENENLCDIYDKIEI